MEEKISISLSMTRELKNKIVEIAKKKNITVTSLIRLAISEYLERNN